MRAFIGIDFEKELKDEIYKLQQRLKGYSKKGRWSHIDNLHLTLKFLDEISSTQQRQIDEVMKKLCTGKAPFSLSLTGIGIFNGEDAIRVLWLGLDGDLQELQSLHENTDHVLFPIGFTPEKKRFKPHITIGRDIVFECSFNQVRDKIGELQFGMTRVNSLTLFKSERIHNKLTYNKVSEYPF